MSDETLHVIIIVCFPSIFFLGAIRELILMSRYLKGDPRRGSYVLNVFTLLTLSVATYFLGYSIEVDRRALLQLLPIPPQSRYALERNGLLHDTTWVVVSKESVESIRAYYRNYARAHDLNMIEDDHDGSRLLFNLPSGKLFLTLTSEGDSTVLYFSREGAMRTIVVP